MFEERNVVMNISKQDTESYRYWEEITQKEAS